MFQMILLILMTLRFLLILMFPQYQMFLLSR
jgi:hypothetical protein